VGFLQTKTRSKIARRLARRQRSADNVAMVMVALRQPGLPFPLSPRAASLPAKVLEVGSSQCVAYPQAPFGVWGVLVFHLLHDSLRGLWLPVQPWCAEIRTQIKHCLAVSDRHRHQRLAGNSSATLSLSNGRGAEYAYARGQQRSSE